MTLDKFTSIIIATGGILMFAFGYYLIFGRNSYMGYIFCLFGTIIIAISVWEYPYKTKEEIIEQEINT